MKRIPTSRFASCTSTFRPARASTIAAASPDGPAPAIRITSISAGILRSVSDVNSAKPRGGFAVLVAAGIFLPRIAEFVREKVFAHFLGNSDAAGIYRAAIRIPNVLQNLFGEGVLSASFIPVYARLLAENDEKTAGRVAGIIATLLALAMAVLVLIGVLLTPWLLII